jgi:HlyD family secretion protein
MDVPRSKTVVRNRKIRRAIYLVLTLVAVGGVSVYLAKLKPQAPPLERATQIISEVTQGEFIVNVRGNGLLQPEDLNYVPALTAGRVEKRHIQVGEPVTPDTVIVTLTSPEAQQALQDAQLALNKAESEYTNQRVALEAQLLTQQAQFAQIEAEYQNAKLLAKANENLAKDNLVPQIDLERSKTSVAELAKRVELEEKRIRINTEAVKTQLSVAQSTLDQQKEIYKLRQNQVENLKVKAGMNGLLQELSVFPGQPVTAGQSVARVSDPKRLKAEIRITETQARDIAVGMRATVDTHNSIIPGRVSRKDPGAVEGTITIDIRLEGPLPREAIPQYNVEGIVEITRMQDVIQVQRPAFGQENSTVRLFRLTPDGNYAEAVQVQFGKQSVTQIQILSGLKVGDRVIVSDTQSQIPDTADRVHLR